MPNAYGLDFPEGAMRKAAEEILAGERAAESRIISRTEREIAAAIEALTDRYPATSHAAINHAARVALGNAPERWHHA